MHFSSVLLVAGAAVASAHPSPHAHGHGHVHQKRGAETVVTVETVFETVYVEEPTSTQGGIFAEVTTTSTTSTTPTTTSTPPPPPPPTTTSTTTTPKASPSSAPSAASGGSANSGSAHVYTNFPCSGSKRATDAQIAYQGNVGTPYGCNIMLVDSSIADQYTYSIDFQSTGSDYTCTCWNKYGNDGLLDGWYQGKGQPVTFSISGSSTQAVAFQPNSQGACACGSGSTLPVITKSGTAPGGGYFETGAIAGIWAEFDFGSGANGGWSGFDVSSLMAQRNEESFPGMQLCSADCSGTCSSISANAASSNNAYIAGTEAADGIGGNCPESKIKITAKVG